MNKSLQTLLRLDDLVLTRKALELAGNKATNGDFGYLNEEIEKLRRRLAPSVMSRYDRLARRYADPLSMLTGDVCNGCQGDISKRTEERANPSQEVLQCEHCGRLIFSTKQAPDYVT